MGNTNRLHFADQLLFRLIGDKTLFERKAFDLLVPQRDVRYPEPRDGNVNLINSTELAGVPFQSIVFPFLHYKTFNVTPLTV